MTITNRIADTKAAFDRFAADCRDALDADTAEKAVAVLREVVEIPESNSAFWGYADTGAFSNGAWAYGALWLKMPALAREMGLPTNAAWAKIWAKA